MTSKLHETSNVTQALFCTANKAINIQSSITFVNHAALFNNNCVSSDEGDFHLSGLVIASLESNSLNKSPYKVRTILDSGAGTNFISETILPHIKHEYLATKTLQVTGINSSEHKEFKLVRVFISKQYSPDMQIKCYTLPNILKYKVDVNQYKSLFLDYPNEFKNPLLGAADHGDGIGLVLGPGSIRDISVSNPQYQGSYLVDFTIFGPAVSGRLPTGNQLLSTYGVIQSYNTLLGETDDQVTFSPDSDIDSKLDLLQGLEFMHDKEQLGIKPQELHHNDLLCIQKFKETIYHDKNTKKYIASLPFNTKKYSLPTNEYQALRRTQTLQREFLKDRNYGLMYLYQIQSLLELDKIEEVFPDTPSGDLIHYLPHRGVVKSDSKTTSLRVVMDASAKPNGSSVSLNDCLYTGPNLIVNMCTLLLKFRTEKFAACADVEKAFLNIMLREADRDVLRFYFPKDIFDPNSPMRVFRYKCVMFGASSSPFLLAAVIEVHLEKHIQDRILRQSLKNIFIDNLIATANSEEELLTFYYKARSVYSDMGLNLRQWSSNAKLVNDAAIADSVHDSSPKVKTLGFLWEPSTDSIHYNFDLIIKHKHSKHSNYTRRIVLSLGQQLKDTFGFLLPEEMRYREFLQILWSKKLTWDQSFESDKDLVEMWDPILDNIKKALNTSFDRSLITYNNVQLHIFADASKASYGAVAYFVIPPCPEYPEGKSQIRFAKGKVVSLKSYPKIDTIPRLELTGIVVAANLANTMIDAYPNLNFTRKVIWNDSMAVLAQCSRPVNKASYVHNRVIDIRKLCPNFEIRYVKSEENPADQITKPITNKTELWWRGPNWLPHAEIWDIENDFNLFPEGAVIEHPIIKKQSIPLEDFDTFCGVMSVTQQKTEDKSLSNLMWSHGDYRKCITFFSGLTVLIKAMKTPKDNIEVPTFRNCIKSYKIPPSKVEGERLAIKTMQLDCFPHIIKTLEQGKRVTENQFNQLKLFIDENGIIRIHGRVNDEFFKNSNKPILFGYRHRLTILFIIERHRLYNCGPVTYTLNKIRKEIHSPKLRRQIREIIFKCILCRSLIGRPFKYPEHPPLDFYRTKCSRPFYMCGVDFIGPFQVHGSSEIEKAYIIIFSCLVSRALYLVLVSDRRTETFLRAVRELSARHCEPVLFISDNEGAFKAANNVLKYISESSSFQNTKIHWKFLPSRASWMGGIYERLVQLVKIELMKMQGKSKFNLIEWRSHLAEVEAIINDRPLTYVSDDAKEPEVITPRAIIHGCLSESNLATDINIDKAIIAMKEYQNNPIELYKRKLVHKNQFWSKLCEEYIQLLNTSAYRKNKSQGKYCHYIPEVGGVVSIKDPETKLGGRLGYITRLIPSTDGLIRKAEVRTTLPSPRISFNKNLPTVYKIKAINQLIPLELKVEMEEQISNIDFSSVVNRNMECPNPVRTSTLPSNDISNNITRNVESPNPADISHRLEFNVLPDNGKPCDLPNCKRPKPNRRNLKLVQCTNTNCNKWCHYQCANIQYKTTFTPDQEYLCPICISKNASDQSVSNGTVALNNRGVPARKTALIAKSKLKSNRKKGKHYSKISSQKN